MEDIRTIEIIAPNFKKRLSGVTSTIVQLVPRQRESGLKIVTLGPGLPDDLPKMQWWQVPGLWRKPLRTHSRIWHARRNIEMLVGVAMRDILRMPMKLVFTSAAQRDHTAFTRWLINRMDDVIATSARSGSYLKVPYTVIHHGIDTQLFHPETDFENTTAATKRSPPYIVGCFGRIRAQKGTDLFVRAMIELLPAYPAWTAVICGRATAEHQAFLKTLVQQIETAGLSDRIRIMGEVDDIKPWYRRLSLYVAPSRNEGFGLTPLEAMASGTAVVASDAGAYNEMIVRGKTGAVFDAGNYEALCAALHPYLEDPALARDHAQNGLNYVRENFALEKEVTAITHVYDRLLRP